MKIINFLIASLFVFGQLFAQQRDTTKSFIATPTDTSLADETRFYTVAKPSGYNSSTPTPLIFNLHAYFEPISQYRNSLSIDSIAEANNVIIVYPLGDTCHWNYKPLFFLPDSGIGWNSGIIGGDFDDVAFISRVLDSVESNYNIDTTQIFCMGVSNGGFMTMKIAAAIGDRFTAMANIIGFDSLSPTTDVPMLSILGTKDTISRINGIPGTYSSWSSVRSKWLNQNSCSTSFLSDTLADIDTLDGSWVEKRTYNSCSNRGTFIEYMIWNGGHNVPNTGVCVAPPIVCNALGSINNDFDPSVEIWNFFNANVVISVKRETLNTKNIHVYPNPFRGELNFQVEKTSMIYNLKIFDIQGKEIYQENMKPTNGVIRWLAKDLAPSIYIYQITDGVEFKSGKVQLLR